MRISAGELYHTNENKRKYTMVELTVDIDEAGSGAAAVTDINVRPDFSNSDRDTYNTAHDEACDGFESQIREGDAEEKCSFGHRLDKTQNCYGKEYGQNVGEASAACAIIRLLRKFRNGLLWETLSDGTITDQQYSLSAIEIQRLVVKRFFLNVSIQLQESQGYEVLRNETPTVGVLHPGSSLGKRANSRSVATTAVATLTTASSTSTAIENTHHFPRLIVFQTR